jgi:RimJ/RimL family protein N-acetyltransferase
MRETETKLLMLGHAFNSGAVRVQFTVDVRNERSQAAIAKLGAVKEGILRRDTRTWPDISVTRSFSRYSIVNGQPSSSGWSNALQN